MTAPLRSQQPPVSPLTDLHFDFPQATRLSNGIKMWVVGNGEDDINRVGIYVAGGTCEEQLPMQATLTAQALTGGNSDMTAEQIAEALDYHGAKVGTQVHDHYTLIGLSSLNDNLAQVLPVLMKCLESPTFPASEVATWRRQLSSNCAMALQRVSFLAAREMKRLYYGDHHPLAAQVTPQQIDALTTEHVAAFHARHYHPAGCVVILSGHIGDREIHTVDDTLGRWSPTGVAIPPRQHEIKPSPVMMQVVDKPGAVQSAIAITLRAIPRRHPHYHLLRLLVMALGGYFGSRLMTTIREDKGYTYGIGASLLGRADDAFIGISTECDTRYTRAVIDEIKNEMRRLREEPIPPDELLTVKQHVLSDLAKTLDTPFSVASHVAGTFLHGTYPEYYNEQVAAIAAATPPMLQEMARRYLREQLMRIVVAGDRSRLQAL